MQKTAGVVLHTDYTDPIFVYQNKQFYSFLFNEVNKIALPIP